MEYQVAVLPTNPFETNFPKGSVHSWNNREQNSICLGFPMRPTTAEQDNKKNNHNNMSEDSAGQPLLLAIVFPEGKLESFRTTGYEEPLAGLLPDLSPEDLEIVASQLRANQIG